MSTEENKAIVRRWFEEVISRGNMNTLDLICAQCHPQFVVQRGVAEPPPQGIPAFKNLITSFRTAFPDFQATVEEQIAEGDKVVSRLTVTGTHRAEFMGIPPTGKPFNVSAVSIWEVKGGLLISEWVNWDTMGMMQQLGGSAAARASRLAPRPGNRCHAAAAPRVKLFPHLIVALVVKVKHL
jgi:steroid delta-isomerase-like uncharacterized protein